MRKQRRTLGILDYAACFVLSAMFTAAPDYMEEGVCQISMSFVLKMLANILFFLGLAYLIRKLLNRWSTRETSFETKGSLESLFSGKHAVIRLALMILAAWLIPLIFLYPGTMINDSWAQLEQFMEFEQGLGLYDHHPVFDTLLMGAIIVPAARATGNWQIMFFIYVLLQAGVTALAFAYSVNYAYRKLTLGWKIALGMLLIYCVLPVFPVCVQTISKDALHSWIFVFFAVHFMEVVRTRGNAFHEKWFTARLVLLSLLCCLTKKVGFYVICLSLLSAAIFVKKGRWYLLLSAACSVSLMYAIMPGLMNALHASPGGKQEMFSLPFQMTARYVKYYGEDITEEEYQVLDRVLGMGDLSERYNPTHADPVKGFRQRTQDSDYWEYLKVWFRQGIRHPGAYAAALNSMLAGWFSWSEYDPLMNMDHRTQLDPERIPESAAIRGFSEPTAEAYQDMYHSMYRTPVLQIFFTYGLYSALIPAFAICTVCRREKKKLPGCWLAVLPAVFSLVLGCWMAPVSYQLEGKRYLYPVVYTSMMLMAWCLYIYRERNGDWRTKGNEKRE